MWGFILFTVSTIFYGFFAIKIKNRSVFLVDFISYIPNIIKLYIMTSIII